METIEIIKKLKESFNLPCIIVTKDGCHFLASPQEIGENSLWYGIYDETALSFLKSDDYLMASINSKEIMFKDVISVISWNDIVGYRKWINLWEQQPRK